MASVTSVRISAEQVRRFAELSGDVNPLHTDQVYARATPFGQPVVHGMLAVLTCLAALPERPGCLSWLTVSFDSPVLPGTTYSLETTVGMDDSAELVLLDGRRRVLVITCGFSSRPARCPSVSELATTRTGRRSTSRETDPMQMPPGTRHVSPYSCLATEVGDLSEALDLLGRGVNDFQIQVLAWCSYSAGMEIPGTAALLARLSVTFTEDAPEHAVEVLGRWEVADHYVERGVIDLHGRLTSPAGSGVWAVAEARAWVRPTLAEPRPDSLVDLLDDSAALCGSVAAVIGGSRGLGAAMVMALVLQGATVYLVHQHSTGAVARLRESLGARSDQVVVMQGDCADPQFCRDLAARITAEHDRLDVLVLNAAPALGEQDPDVDDGQRLVAYVQRALSMVHTPLAALGDLVDKAVGSIVWVSSSAVSAPVEGWSHYVTAKTAVEGLARSVRTRYPASRSLVVRPPRLLTTLTSLGLHDDPLPPGKVAAAVVRWLAERGQGGGTTAVLEEFPGQPQVPEDGERTGAATLPEPDSVDVPTLQIVATFTADPVLPALGFWAGRLNLGLRPRLSPYAQVLQELLDPGSAMAGNKGGVNVVLLRPSDWAPQSRTGLTRDLAEAVSTSAGRSGIPHVVIVCPSPEGSDPADTESQHALLKQLQDQLSAVPGAHVLSTDHFGPQYVGPEHHDPIRDRLGHIPYTREGFAGLATAVARSVRAVLRPPAKVLVLDADNTLWDGVCGEDGPQGVRLDAAHLDLQRWALDLRGRGVLLGLVSKNHDADVRAVLQRPDMLVTSEHLAARRVSWSPKSTAIREMVAELDLSLDSVVFVDDSPVEIGEVAARLPQVLGIRLPSSTAGIRSVVDHTWAFDQLEVTIEDRRRAERYQEARERQRFQTSAPDLASFVAGLDLRVDMREVDEEDHARVSQMTYRTTQFNTTGLRLSTGEVARLVERGTACWVASVADRFGDHGITCLAVVSHDDETMFVENLLMSCRVLGKGAEHAVFARLGRIALDLGLTTVELPVIPTERNQPVRDFLQAVTGPATQAQQADGTTVLVHRMSAEAAASVKFDPDVASAAAATARRSPPPATSSRDRFTGLSDIPADLATPAQVDLAVNEPPDQVPVEPRHGAGTARAQSVVEVFSKVLRRPAAQLGPWTRLEDLGLSSMLRVELMAELERQSGRLPSTLLYESETLADVARVISAGSSPSPPDLPDLEPVETRSRPVTEEPRPPAEPMRVDAARGSAVAVVGLAGRYPGARTPDELWDVLSSGSTQVREMPAARQTQAFRDASPGAEGLRPWRGCFLDDVMAFDSLYFKISPLEAAAMDPQQRLFLETATEALQDAGYTSAGLGRHVGVYVGAMACDYAVASAHAAVEGTAALPHSALYQIANRVSYVHDFHGPSITVDTACSSSGVAVHLACQDLRSGKVEAAVVGGVNLILHPARFIQYSHMGMLSLTGACRPFGAGADGMVLGEGAGAALLKPLEAAERDGDHIYGVLRGSAVNTAGHTQGFTVPSPSRQSELVRDALEDAGLSAERVSVVEAHGTGTPLGDPIEIRGLAEALASRRAVGKTCLVSSVKSVIGHLEPAAGIAGLTKVLLQLRHQTVLPSLGAEETSPEIDFATTPFSVPTVSCPWPDEGEPRVVGVSSFGAGGVNAHLVVEEYRSQAVPQAERDGEELVVLSARADDQLVASAQRLHDHLCGVGADLALADVAYTLRVGRRPMERRLALVVADRESLIRALEEYVEDGPDTVSSAVCLVGQRPGGQQAEGLTHVLGTGYGVEFLARLGGDGELSSLATLWVQGVEIPWPEVLPARGAHRVSLPTYPFASPVHALAGTGPQEQPVQTGPDRQPDRSDDTADGLPLGGGGVPDNLDDTGIQVHLDGAEPWLRDHVISGEYLVPGVICLDLVLRLAVRTASPAGSWDRGPYLVSNVVWATPLAVSGSGLTVSVRSEDTDTSSRALGLYRDEPGAPAAVRAVVTRAARAEVCELAAQGPEVGTTWSTEEVYANLAGRGMAYGPSLQGLRSVEAWADGARSVVALPATSADHSNQSKDHVMHPAILDGALQTVLVGSGRSGAYLPYSLSECWVSARGVQEEATVQVSYRRRDATMLRCDLDVVAADGTLLTALRDLVLLPAADEPARSGNIRALRPVWQEGDSGGLPPEADGAAGPTHVVVLSQERTDHEAWCRAQASGDWTLVGPEDLDGLLADGSASTMVVDYRGLRGGPTSAAERLSQVRDVTTAVLRAQGVATHLLLTPPAESDPAAVAAAGFSLAATRESAGLRSVRVEVPRADDVPAPQALLAEWRHSDVEVRAPHPGAGRQVRGFEEVAPTLQASRLRQGAHYVVTGGGGGIGRRLGHWLARTLGASVLLLGRSPQEPWAGERPQTAPGEVRYMSCDVTDRDALADVLAQERAAYGPLHGVIHAAGVIDDAPAVQKSYERCARVLAPKATGAALLDVLTSEDPLELFVMMSSTSGTLGSAGQCSYSMANRFLDAFAEHRQAQVRRGARLGHTVSLIWPLWSDGGMKPDPTVDQALRQATGFTPVSSEEAFTFFEQALALDEPVVMAAHGDTARIRSTLLRRPAPRPTRATAHRRVEAPGPSRIAVAAVLRELAVALLHIDEHDLEGDVEFSEVGFDSVLYAEFATMINERLGTDVSPVVFFDHATVDLLADHLLVAHTPRLPDEAGASTVNHPGGSRTAEPQVRLGRAETTGPGTAPAGPGARQEAGDQGEEVPVWANDVAVVGMAGRFPGADDLETFWQNLVRGVDSVREVPTDRWDWREQEPKRPGEPGATRCRWGGFLSDIEAFDHELFHISGWEAGLMDPQQRLFLESSWAALEDSGRDPWSLRGSRTGVFAGVSLHDHLHRLLSSGAVPVGHLATGNVHAIVANRVSHLLDLRGPSEVVDTACSSSLTALHRAVTALRAGECDLAVVGGVNALLTPFWFAAFDNAGMLSPQGRCATFDASADGYVRGEGVGVVVLRRLRDALEDGDTVHGVVTGTAVAHGGRAHSLTAPRPAAQAEVVAAAHHQAGDRAPVSYVETHGTGTPLGDPIEVEGLRLAGIGTDATGAPRADRVYLGSLKSAIGHLESASGVAGLIKVLLAMRHRWLPGNLHYETPNPHLGLAGTTLCPLDRGRAWEPVDAAGDPVPLRAGLSAFGFGGTNAHVVLDEPPAPARRCPASGSGPLVATLSAPDPDRLQDYARSVAKVLSAGSDCLDAADVAWTLRDGRPALEHRVAVVAESVPEMARGLRDFADRVERVNVFSSRVAREDGASANGDEGPVPSARETRAEVAQRQAREWVRGGPPPDLPSSGGPRRRVSLPTHPFARVPIPFGTALPGAGAVNDPAGERLVLLRPSWVPVKAPPAVVPQTRPTVVVLAGSGAALDLAAAAHAVPGARWVLLREDTGLPQVAREEYVLGKTAAEAEATLESVLTDHEIDAVIDLTGVDPGGGPVPEERLEDQLLPLIGRRLRSAPDAQLRVLVVGRQTWERPDQARRMAVVRALGAEYQRVVAGALELDPVPDDPAELLTQALTELCRLDEQDPGWTLLQGQDRWARSFEEISAPTPALVPGRFGPFGIDPEDTYVITGGTSGLGLAVAERLVERGARRLALLGRRPLPAAETWDSIGPDHPRSASVAALRRLRHRGAAIATHTGSLADQADVADFLRRCTGARGRIAGVVHCAGDVPRAPVPFLHQSPDEVRQSWQAKDSGWDVVAGCLQQARPDFIVLFSSVSAALPALSAGWASYAGANAYLDAEAMRCWGQDGGTALRSIGWASWQGAGTGVVTTPEAERSGLRPLSVTEGLDLLERALMVDEPHLLAVKIDPQHSTPVAGPAQSTSQEQGRAEAASTPAPPGLGAPLPAAAGTEAFLLGLFEEHLKVSREALAAGATFGELGVDSIFIAGLVPMLEQYLGRPVQPTTVLEHDTVHALAAALGAPEGAAPTSGQHPPGPPDLLAAPRPVSSQAEEPAAGCGPVAIIGMAGRYPGAPDLEAFWEVLSAGRCTVREVPRRRWDVDALYRRDWQPGAITSRWGGFLEDVDQFDPEYFGIDPEVATEMHPSIRVFLEVGDATLRSAGYDRSELDGRRVGVYVGGGTEGHGSVVREPGPHSATAQNQSFLAAQLAQWLNLRGPHLVVDTACSSSLAALHLGLQAVRAGDCDLCLVGGVDLLLDEMPYLRLSAARALSPDGLCRAFDAGANGLVLGEGAGAVLLKPLKKAVADGDQVMAVVEGTAMNNDGRTMGLTTPNPQAQQEVVEEALSAAGVAASSVSYVEAHGTGTLIGDPIEMQALSAVFDAATAVHRSCGIGSVKSNIGHLLRAAGMASLHKVLLALAHGQLPPTLHCQEPNPRFNLADSALEPVTSLTPWPERDGVRRAGVSAFGFGGTNVHVVLRGAQPSERSAQARQPLPDAPVRRRSLWAGGTGRQRSRPATRRREPLLVLQEGE
ncbi:SDR family NAD(P)-dependent oxidoreductase [Actinomyces sp. 2119]|uniref:SDR family NAD(P)-dependent oxidoreductase n=1 Tax=Actinomyces sp. 2119 TaxID=2321393 RepID=UPI000E6B671E|nr:SDR family NAD(P)-dependent oxidoreductase [Actinomyces sp. 2119]RJF41182.1 SDR family NAD(P)-dependent oxidoreductase [Actinomyces sp. 2119]